MHSGLVFGSAEEPMPRTLLSYTTGIAACIFVVVGVVYSVITLEGPVQIAVIVTAPVVIFLAFSKASSGHVAIAMSLYLFAHTHASRLDSSLGVIARALALVVILVASVRTKKEEQSNPSSELLVLAILGTLAYAAAIFVHGTSMDSVTDFASFALSCLTLIVAYKRLPAAMLRRGVESTICVAIVLSLASGVFAPGTAIEAGRLEGIFVNANTLGFFAALALLMGLTQRPSGMRTMIIVSSAVCLVATGSRSPLLSMAVAMSLASIVAIARGEPKAIRLIVLTLAGCFGGYVAVNSYLSADLSLFRTNDSRTPGTTYALDTAAAHPWQGVGYGMAQIEVASSPLRWLTETGVIGLLCVVICYAAILIMSLRYSWHVFMVAVFGVIHSNFEGWYFAGGSGLFFAYWLTYIYAIPPPPSTNIRRISIASTHPGV